MGEFAFDAVLMLRLDSPCGTVVTRSRPVNACEMRPGVSIKGGHGLRKSCIHVLGEGFESPLETLTLGEHFSKEGISFRLACWAEWEVVSKHTPKDPSRFRCIVVDGQLLELRHKTAR